MAYARGTNVPAEQTRMEIERIVNKYGATAFTYGINSLKAMIQFEANERIVRFILPLPQVTDKCVIQKRVGKYLKTIPFDQRARRAEQLARERWRALRICILSKLEAVQAGITQFEEEFFAHVVDPSTGKTVYELVSPRIAIAYSDHPKPIALPAPDDEEIVQ